ncbi:MAG TPA: hypothetical protein VI489_05055 [Candidatus Brocadiaceae bacterium]
MSDEVKINSKDSWIDDFKGLIDGGTIMLFIFGSTICFLASASLIAIFLTKETEVIRIALFKEILIGALGYLTGIFTTMWNNQHFKAKNGNGTQPKE